MQETQWYTNNAVQKPERQADVTEGDKLALSLASGTAAAMRLFILFETLYLHLEQCIYLCFSFEKCL